MSEPTDDVKRAVGQFEEGLEDAITRYNALTRFIMDLFVFDGPDNTARFWSADGMTKKQLEDQVRGRSGIDQYEPFYTVQRWK